MGHPILLFVNLAPLLTWLSLQFVSLCVLLAQDNSYFKCLEERWLGGQSMKTYVGQIEEIKMFPWETKIKHKGKFINLDRKEVLSANGFYQTIHQLQETKETLGNKKTPTKDALKMFQLKSYIINFKQA